jgi:flagellar protein FliO/FliZ
MRALLINVALLLCAPVLAQEEAQGRVARLNTTAPPELFTAGYLVQVIGSLLLVFICLFGVVYFLRRFNGVSRASGSVLRVLGTASVGQREKVVLIDAGGEQLLLGVAQGSVRTLHVFDEPIVTADEATASPAFAEVLRAANPLGERS